MITKQNYFQNLNENNIEMSLKISKTFVPGKQVQV